MQDTGCQIPDSGYKRVFEPREPVCYGSEGFCNCFLLRQYFLLIVSF